MKTNVCYQGDCLDVLKTLPENSIDSIVTDPPYELGFMGKSWDNSGIAYSVPMWRECLRVLKPGGHLLSFSGTRTYHRMAVSIEDAGFEVRDMIEWVYGSGFPKSLNIGKAVDKLQGNEREELGYREDFVKRVRKNGVESKDYIMAGGWKADPTEVGKLTKGTSEWEGWGTALKPAHEPICMARKPLAEKTIAENCLKWGTGGINIDESRVETEDKYSYPNGAGGNSFSVGEEPDGKRTEPVESNSLGRFPANLIHDNSEEVRECFPETKAGVAVRRNGNNANGIFPVKISEGSADVGFNDSGNASRFFKSIIYQAKASKSERNKGMDELEAKPMYKADGSGQSLEIFGSTDGGREDRKNNHPTVKPIALMSYLIKMITPKGGIVLDPFTGSGSTLVAAKENGFEYVGIELTEEYLPIIQARTGCEIIHNTKNVIQEAEIKPIPVVKEKTIDMQKPKNDIQLCECGGKIKKTASGRCCEWCLKDY